MSDYERSRNDLDALLREHGGLEGLAREIGQHDPAAALYEDTNDNDQPTPAGRFVGWLLIATIVAIIILAFWSEAKAQLITPEQYHATGRPCACPDDVMKNGQKCGTKSAYCRCNGAEPLCYPGDDDKEKRHSNRMSVCGHACN
jgi:hypothetical protein